LIEDRVEVHSRVSLRVCASMIGDAHPFQTSPVTRPG
jgi:hypothetical protein